MSLLLMKKSQGYVNFVMLDNLHFIIVTNK